MFRIQKLLFGICLIGFCPLVFGKERAEAFPSPNHEWELRSAPGTEPYRYKLELMDRTSLAVIGSYDPEVRAFEALWSPDSRFVAINEDITHSLSGLSVYSVGRNGWKRLNLLDRLKDKSIDHHTSEPITRLLPEVDHKALVYWAGAHGPTARRWINDSDLEIRFSAEGILTNKRYLELEYQFIVRFMPDGSSHIISEKKLSYQIKAETQP